MTFKPTQVGPRTASATITDNALGSPQSVVLSGTGVVAGPNVTLSTTSLAFATQTIGTPNSGQSVTLSNYGTVRLTITSIVLTGAAPGDFRQTNTCGNSIAPGASCTINVTFTPTQAGSRTAMLSISDNASGSPQTVSLAATGTVVQLNPVSLIFGSVTLGQSRTLATTLTNVGGTALSISNIHIGGTDYDEFHRSNKCGSSLGPGASCVITVTFRPTEVWGESAYISVSDSGGGSPQQVQLRGGVCCAR